MRRPALVLACALLWAALATSPATAQPRPITLLEGLDFPTGIAFAKNGDMYFNERPGRIRVVRDGRLEPEPVATIETTLDGETGLLGIAIPPDEREDPSLYVFSTEPDGVTNSVYRVPMSGGAPEAVVEGLPASIYHNGGGVAFDSKGALFVSNGEQHTDDRAQDPTALGGKVYRFSRTGAIPPTNPFGTPPAPTYALGLRNPYGLAIDPVTDAPFVTENGPSSHDEVNRIELGANYGWPEIEGPAGDIPTEDLVGTYRDPLLNYPEIVVPTGIAFADPQEAAPPYRGDLFFGTFGEGILHRVELNDARDAAVSDEAFVEEGDGIVAVAWGPGGIYYSTESSIEFVALAGSRRSTEGSAAPPGGIPEAPEEDGESLVLTLVIAGAVAALVAALLFALVRSRRQVH